MSGAERNFYQVLGVKADVSPAEIKRVYRRLAKEQHPDATDGHLESAAKKAATEEMMRINEAYATLADPTRRAEYDIKIGIKQTIHLQAVFTAVNEDQERARFLQKIFHPSRNAILKVLNSYSKELRELSADPFDDELVENFQEYLEKLHNALKKGADAFGSNEAPRSLQAAVQMMKYSIAQAADGLEELKYYCANYDHNHLTMAESLFRIAHDLSKQSLDLSKNG